MKYDAFKDFKLYQEREGHHFEQQMAKEFLDEKSNKLAFLILSTAIREEITIRQVFERYEREETPIHADFDDKLLLHSCESRMRLVKKKKPEKLKVDEESWEIVKNELIVRLAKKFNIKV